MSVLPIGSQDGARNLGGVNPPSFQNGGRDRRRDDARLRTLVTLNADGLLVVGRDDGIVRYCNPAAGNLLGQPPEDLVGQPFRMPTTPGQTADIDIVCPAGGVG